MFFFSGGSFLRLCRYCPRYLQFVMAKGPLAVSMSLRRNRHSDPPTSESRMSPYEMQVHGVVGNAVGRCVGEGVGSSPQDWRVVAWSWHVARHVLKTCV